MGGHQRFVVVLALGAAMPWVTASCGIDVTGALANVDAAAAPPGTPSTSSGDPGSLSGPANDGGAPPSDASPESAPSSSSDASSAPDASSPMCPAGYSAITNGPIGSRYRAATSLTTWLGAEAACEAEGTHLAVIGDAVERDAVLAIATGEIWIGFSDRVIAGVWRNVTGSSPKYFDWDTANNEPSTATEDDCALLRKTSSNGTPKKMDAKPCMSSTLHSFVCECDGLPVDKSAY